MTVPERIGDYAVNGVLGSGKASVVYRAFDANSNREIAVKAISRSLIEGNIKGNLVAQSFRRRVLTASSLKHPGIVESYGYGEDDAYIFAVMEPISGRTLAEYFADGRRFDQADAVNLVTQVLAALEYAHNRSIWHYDLKPSNILIANDGRVLVANFGIDTANGDTASSIAGTPGFISPERYLGKPADHRADIFAAGAIFYQLLAGYAPFEGSRDAIMHSVCYRNLDVPSRSDPTRRWPQYDAVVERALMKRPEERYPSAGAFRTAALAAYAYPLDDTIPAIAVKAMPIKEQPADPVAGRPLGVAGIASVAGPFSGTPEGWDPDLLGTLERELATFVGPIAKVLVTRGARAHSSFDTLTAALIESLETPTQREAFLAAVRGGGAARRGPESRSPDLAPSSVGGARSQLPGEELDLATRLLAVHIGPVARVVVRRTAAANLRRADFYRQLALQIDDEAARASFLSDAGVF